MPFQKGYINMLQFQTSSDLINRENAEYKATTARIVAPHTVEYRDYDGSLTKVTAKHILIATGTRPLIPTNLDHVREHVITSDDLFWCPYAPGRTLVIGGGYIALECASFLRSIGFEVTVIVR